MTDSRASTVYRIFNLIICALVDFPEAIEIQSNERDTDRTISLSVTVDPRDLGKLIGKQGRTARAIRTVMATVADKADTRCMISIEKSGPKPDPGEGLESLPA
jgi:uncharacterized protein